MNHKMNTVCFSGPRAKKLVGYDYRRYDDLVNTLTQMIINLAENGTTHFISGGAQGFDQLAFWSVDRAKRMRPDLNIRNILYIPFHEQESRWQKHGAFGQEDYRKMLSRADEIKYTCDTQPANVTSVLMQRNTDMLNSSAMCIGLWSTDDTWMNPQTKGGTADALRKAKHAGLCINIIQYTIENNVIRPRSVVKY